MDSSKRKLFRPFDILIILIVLSIGVVTLLSFFGGSDTTVCVIKVDGEQVYSVALSDVTQDIIKTVDGDLPVTVHINQSGVSVVSSKCPDKICEHTGVIVRAGQSIVCLPAKVSVTLVSDSGASFDAVAG